MKPGKAVAIAKITAKIDHYLRMADRRTGAAKQVYLDAAAKLKKAIC